MSSGAPATIRIKQLYEFMKLHPEGVTYEDIGRALYGEKYSVANIRALLSDLDKTAKIVRYSIYKLAEE